MQQDEEQSCHHQFRRLVGNGCQAASKRPQCDFYKLLNVMHWSFNGYTLIYQYQLWQVNSWYDLNHIGKLAKMNWHQNQHLKHQYQQFYLEVSIQPFRFLLWPQQTLLDKSWSLLISVIISYHYCWVEHWNSN